MASGRAVEEPARRGTTKAPAAATAANSTAVPTSWKRTAPARPSAPAAIPAFATVGCA